MDEQRLSVALCTYDGARFLREQLDSVARQTRLPYELVVCDDRSSDNTVEIVKAFSSSAPFPVRLYVNEENVGPTKNFEKAIGLCEGDIIALSDQDDVWHPEKLERSEDVLLQTPRAGAVFADADIVDDNLRPLGYQVWKALGFTQVQRGRFARGRALEILLRRNVVQGATLVFRASFKELILPIPVGWMHDAWIAFLIAASAELAFVDEPLMKYRQHPRNVTGVAKEGFVEVVARAKNTEARHFWNVFHQYESAYARLSTLVDAGYDLHPGALPLLQEKILHWQARAAMPSTFRQRLPVVLRELVTLRYSRYSKWWRSFAGDLFLR